MASHRQVDGYNVMCHTWSINLINFSIRKYRRNVINICNQTKCKGNKTIKHLPLLEKLVSDKLTVTAVVCYSSKY